ncbi:M20 family metallopeptidase [Sporosalibacterium faouarense]|uniref:M20 family metallopeptidase n=1 Tax=Sporosalibacterium faouarense TaxID=516123 RepID=UPI00192CE257|nr:M20 family metallopeptidase [Sporosalibacterium faouarense]
MIDKVTQTINEIMDELKELSEYIYNNPELGYEEIKSSAAHIELLKKYGFNVEKGYMGMETAFRAEFDSGKEGPTIGYLAEYDALPEIGHGCGHNILGTTSTGAGITLSKFLDEIGGRVVVFGTPAEETSGGKVIMADNGAFNDIDVAMMTHPNHTHTKSGASLALQAIQFTFKGKSAHAAAHPEKGINALDGAINTFNNINALREHIKSTARIHGIIKDGGRAANIVPDLAIAQFYVRARTKTYLEELVEKVKNCANGAALASGTELEITNYEASYDNLVTNHTLSELYCSRLKDMGAEEINEPREGYGSLDMGNVSHVCPSIHPHFSISDEEIIAHTREFAQATIKNRAYKGMREAIGALVLTAIDVIKDDSLLKAVKKEFNNTKK